MVLREGGLCAVVAANLFAGKIIGPEPGDIDLAGIVRRDDAISANPMNRRFALRRAASSARSFRSGWRAPALAALAALVPARLWAHTGAPPAPHDLWRSWALAP